MMKKTKIVATIGPSSESEEKLSELIDSGMNVTRLNFSHGNHEEHLKRIETIKKVRKEKNSHTAIMLDTKGPEIRTGNFKEEEVYLEEGQNYTITTRNILGDNTICSVTYENLTEDVIVGDSILIDDGLVELEITNIVDTDIHCIVKNSGKISNHKGVNVPMVNINLPAVTEKDILDIKFAIKNELDFIAASFVRKAEDVLQIRTVLEENNGEDIKIISKIENFEGVKNIEEIIKVSNGIMVARGDLGVEIPPEEVPLVQKEIIKKCNKVGKPVITATQMLDSMIRNPRPTRAEVTDVANAILDGTDAIMLSGETAMGKYPVETLTTMKNIAVTTEKSVDYRKLLKDKKEKVSNTITNAISYSACSTSESLCSKAIFTPTASGYTAVAVSKYRPKAYIVAPTQSEKVARYLNLIWGVYPVIAEKPKTTDDLLNNAIKVGKENKLIETGDIIVITAGIPVGVRGSTNMIKVHRVEEESIEGVGIGEEKAQGRVCIAKTAEDLEEKFNRGDIVVVHSVDKDMVKYLEKSNGFITEVGGYTSNGVIIAINLNKPVIVNCEEATLKLEDGEIVTIDPKQGLVYKGEIEILE